MRRNWTTGIVAVIAILAISAATAGGAWAFFKAPFRLEESGVVLSTNEAFSATGTDEVSFTTPAGDIECDGLKDDQSGLRGRDQTWVEPVDRLEVQEVTGAIGNESPSSRVPCKSSVVALGATAAVYSEGLPWSLSVSLKKKAELKSIQTGLFFDMYFEGGAMCFFNAALIRGTNTGTLSGLSPLQVAFHEQKLKLLKGSSADCPKTAAINLGFSSFRGPHGGVLEEQ